MNANLKNRLVRVYSFAFASEKSSPKDKILIYSSAMDAKVRTLQTE
jgi:hypothetical protein